MLNSTLSNVTFFSSYILYIYNYLKKTCKDITCAHSVALSLLANDLTKRSLSYLFSSLFEFKTCTGLNLIFKPWQCLGEMVTSLSHDAGKLLMICINSL